jgi:hypothetical protein
MKPLNEQVWPPQRSAQWLSGPMVKKLWSYFIFNQPMAAFEEDIGTTYEEIYYS